MIPELDSQEFPPIISIKLSVTARAAMYMEQLICLFFLRRITMRDSRFPTSPMGTMIGYQYWWMLLPISTSNDVCPSVLFASTSVVFDCWLGSAILSSCILIQSFPCESLHQCCVLYISYAVMLSSLALRSSFKAEVEKCLWQTAWLDWVLPKQ